MDRQEEIKRKNQKAEEAMRRAKKAQQANEKMQRELQAAARELARHQELARKASMQENTVREAVTEERRPFTAAGRTVSVKGTDNTGQSANKMPQKDSQTKGDTTLKQQEASREAARQAMIYEAAKRRAEKKEAAKRAAELIAAQRAAEKKVHHTSPETKELQNILLQQIADIMEEKDPDDAKVNQNTSDGQNHKPASTERFGDLVIMDVHGEELQPESSAALEKKIEKKRITGEQDAIQDTEPEAKLETWGRMGTWFLTFCWMHIPIIGFWYMVTVALRRRTPKEKKAFARAYILYRILVLILACTILYIFYRMGLSFFEQILSYMEGHQ